MSNPTDKTTATDGPSELQALERDQDTCRRDTKLAALRIEEILIELYELAMDADELGLPDVERATDAAADALEIVIETLTGVAK